MIRFNCQNCGRAFTVRDEDAGRRAKCKSCGNEVTVPATSDVVPTDLHAADGVSSPGGVAAEPPRLPMRLRRLTADAEQMRAAFGDTAGAATNSSSSAAAAGSASGHAIRIVAADGDPPELYRLEYQVNSLERGKRPDQPVPRTSHLVEIQLTSGYPRQSPLCRMLTPVFHPNIDPATICVGDHWAAGERLVDLAVRIGEMLAYQAYNIKSPLDAEAAMWADLNQDKLPTDSRDLRPAGA
ncbi:MAG: hypothetical protein JWO31_1550 [Phycisphaerales bacterium]|nr:hypothetical protein [Phycisphaerales bacterium]